MTAPHNLRVIIIAGPNGAGTTAFAREFLPNEAGCPVFVNADLIAAGLAPCSESDRVVITFLTTSCAVDL